MDKKAYWLWLQEALGAGAVTDEITAVFPSPEEMYSRGEIEWRLSGVLTNRQIEKLKQCSPEKAQGIVDVCYNNGWTVLTPDDEDYPPKLRSLRNMPLALFVRGDIKRVTQRVCIAVVGTRKASFQGSYLAHRYAPRRSHIPASASFPARRWASTAARTTARSTPAESRRRCSAAASDTNILWKTSICVTA